MNASSRKSRFNRAYHEIHGSRLEDDVVVYVDTSGFNRTEAARAAGRPRRAPWAWWKAAAPLERILRLWWWCFCALIGLLFGAMAVIIIGAVAVVFG